MAVLRNETPLAKGEYLHCGKVEEFLYVLSLSVGSASSDRSFKILLHLGGCLLVRVVWCVDSCHTYLSHLSPVL